MPTTNQESMVGCLLSGEEMNAYELADELEKCLGYWGHNQSDRYQ